MEALRVGLAACTVLAFASLARDAGGLFGPEGLAPADQVFEAVAERWCHAPDVLEPLLDRTVPSAERVSLVYGRNGFAADRVGWAPEVLSRHPLTWSCAEPGEMAPPRVTALRPVVLEPPPRRPPPGARRPAAVSGGSVGSLPGYIPGMLLLALLACSEPPPPQPVEPPGPCTVMRTPAAGPRRTEIAAALDHPLEVARLRIEEARLTSDPGFYTLAEQAIDCALERDPTDVEGLRLRAHVLLQFHQFAAAEAVARPLWERTQDAQDAMLLGDALMEQGRLDEAGQAYQASMDLRPGLPIYDRAAWLRWLKGDLPGAVQLQTLAAQAGQPSDPEPLAWVLTRLGWLHALSGAPAPELDVALSLLPDYKPARLARGRLRLHAGDPAAAEDLRFVGATVEAVWALSEVDPSASVEAVGLQDPRGFAMWLADRGRPEDLVRALALLDDELAARQDAVTHMAHAWAVHRAGRDGAAEARAALATGNPEPRLLLQGGLVIGDPALLRRALATGPGLLPSERKRAEAALAR